MNGTKILLKLNVSGSYKYVMGQTSATHDVSVDTFETTNKLGGDAKTFEAGKYSTTLKVDCIIDSTETGMATYADVLAMAKVGAPVAYYYGDDVTLGSKYWSGKAVITKVGEEAKDANAITFSVELQTTGEEKEETVNT